jgi:hypothetical protein
MLDYNYFPQLEKEIYSLNSQIRIAQSQSFIAKLNNNDYLIFNAKIKVLREAKYKFEKILKDTDYYYIK